MGLLSAITMQIYDITFYLNLSMLVSMKREIKTFIGSNQEQNDARNSIKPSDSHRLWVVANVHTAVAQIQNSTSEKGWK